MSCFPDLSHKSKVSPPREARATVPALASFPEVPTRSRGLVAGGVAWAASLQGESGVNPLYRLVVGSYLPGCPAVRFWGHGPCSRTPPLCLCHRRPGGTVPCRPLAARLDAGATQHFGERCASRDLCVLGPRPSRLGPDTRGRRPGGGQLMLWLDAAGQTGQWRSPASADHLRLLLQRARGRGLVRGGLGPEARP